MLSALYCDTYMYQYPFSKEQLSIALKEKFPQGFFDKIHVKNNIRNDGTFTIKYNNTSFSKLEANISTEVNGVSITVKYKSYTGIYLLFIMAFLLVSFIAGAPLNFILFAIISMGIGFAVQYTNKHNLKIDFEQRLGLPTNDDIIERQFIWF